MTAVSRDVFNLEFPAHCHELHIGEHRFSRVQNYRDRVLGLQHWINSQHEFRKVPNQGSHQQTAQVTSSKPDSAAILLSSQPHANELDDILLLLSIVTQRDVFCLPAPAQIGGDDADDLPSALLFRDPRHFHAGGIVKVSIPYEKSNADSSSPSWNFGLEKGLNSAFSLTRSAEWRQRFADGHFISIFRNAIGTPNADARFTLCWTMWEHLFAVLNRRWLEPKTRINARQKILFVFSDVLQVEDTERLKKRVDDLVNARNRLVHFGFLPANDEKSPKWYGDMARLFVELSEMVVVKALQLGEPANHLNTIERLESWLEGKRPVIADPQ